MDQQRLKNDKRRKNITRAQIPTNLMETIKRDYPNYKIDSLESVEKGEDTAYVVELEKTGTKTLKSPSTPMAKF